MSNNGEVSVVLVHGAFVDGAGWESVYKSLKKDGYDVSVVQNSTLSLEEDVAATKLAIAAQKHDVLLVGHSYGGAVITEAGNDPKVVGLVYLAAFAPDKGESVQKLWEILPPDAPSAPNLPPQDGWGLKAVGGVISEAAWRKKPSWFMVATEDRMIPPDAQRQMSKRAGATVVEQKGNHAIYASNPKAVTAFVEKAAQGVSAG
jgi:pimeloyl-ACP methyl ester carboxylesterase